MVVQTISQAIHAECNKPLQSKWYVDAPQKRKMVQKNWRYHDTSKFSVRKSGGLWLCYDRTQNNKLSDCEREQLRLYKQLKREYEQSQKQATEVEKEKIELAKEKARTTAHKKSMQLLSGLITAPRYDRIYCNA